MFLDDESQLVDSVLHPLTWVLWLRIELTEENVDLRMFRRRMAGGGSPPALRPALRGRRRVPSVDGARPAPHCGHRRQVSRRAGAVPGVRRRAWPGDPAVATVARSTTGSAGDRRPLAPTTRKRCLIALRSFLRFAQREEWLAHDL